jgi:hypothetical protein
MQDAAGMGEGYGIADGGERREQADEFQLIFSALKPFDGVRMSRAGSSSSTCTRRVWRRMKLYQHSCPGR